MKYLSGIFAFLLLGSPGIAAQAASTPGCTAEIRGNRPRIYIANFLVTYGKKDMGQAIGDYIAQKFTADGRFDVIPRSEVQAQMAPLLNKNINADKYLATTVSMAGEKKADCVIFGKISRKGKLVSFLVRMASVASGENLRKVDTDVDRENALGFLESVGNEFVGFFTTPPQQATVESTDRNQHRGFFLNINGGGGYLAASKPIGNDLFSIESAAAQAGVKVGGAVRPGVIVFGAFDGFMAVNATGKLNVTGPAVSVSASDLAHTVGMLGGGITVYSDTNFFFSATIGAVTGTLGYAYLDTKASGNSGYGFGLNLSLGQEWWLARRLGFGFALLGHYSNMPAGNTSTNQYYGGLALTATYN